MTVISHRLYEESADEFKDDGSSSLRKSNIKLFSCKKNQAVERLANAKLDWRKESSSALHKSSSRVDWYTISLASNKRLTSKQG